ncbi:MAG TPA: DNA translocase FtsK [Paracoccus sp. (in: a-proteobacteria)]|uniref:DNA translocase FtsK n=1 Tax=uncultured Paracoccus sp. TaxID=189685 RepID=UPI00260372AD|nr:DNA translocase FtsK [uncultured Paracoccus sp.]HMQ41564.1 DNA translocase FtsK [Paracoccus sp. (in: a-proteobacteria)]HMR36853.1 DNA translocase FtsK [Paracoccus sp. (in: a-proteobacteria)]
MASWQAKGRDPLFDQNTQAALERRGKELIGAGLVVLAAVLAMVLYSWSPDDPSFLAATDQPPVNLLGRFGAYLAAPLMMIAGYGAWGLALGSLVWGLRLMLHKGEDRVMRAVFLPIAVALGSVYCASMVPPFGWDENFGLGGHFGDMMMGGLMAVLPFGPAASLKIGALMMVVGAIGFYGFVLGFDMAEARRLARWLATGLVTAYDGLLRLLGKGAVGAMGAAQGLKARAAERRAQPEIDAEPGNAPKRGLFRRRSQPEEWEDEGELVEPEAHDATAPSSDEVSARITDVISKRGGSLLSSVTQRLNANRQDVMLDGPEDEDEAIEPADPHPFGAATARLVTPVKKPAAPSRQAQAEAQPSLRFDDSFSDFECPPLSLLTAEATIQRHQLSDEALAENARMLEAVLDDYGVKGQITAVHPGPVVTLYELEPAPGLKASRVIGLSDDIARSMSALSARVSTVPGRTVIGIELPNARREKVLLREILSAKSYGDASYPLPLALGKDIGGGPVVANLAKMPHLLIAGTTGSGKSVAINTMILSLLYKLTPDECRLIMIDPKMLELSVYDGIPHLLSPVVTDPKKAVVALKWVVAEMEERYRKMSKMGVRNIEGYNGRVREAQAKDEMFKRTVQTGFDEDTGEPIFETEEFQPETFPYIVVIVDEMADLMMVAGKEIEACIQRLAQMARASGIHLIMATQRPSVDVITGTIKANFPTRISFQVTSKIDSRTILGEQGAEQLLGQGDMLYMAGGSKITRVHGPFVSDEEVEEVVNHLKSFGPPSYKSGVVDGPEDEVAGDIDAVLGLGNSADGDDQLYDQAVMIVAKDRKCSTSYIQRKLAIGYNKAARIVEMMEDQGVVSSANHVGKREVLVPEI